MVTWIVIGALLLGLLILALAVRPVLVRLVGLRRAVLLMLRRQRQAETLVASAQSLQERILALQTQAELAQRGASALRARQTGE